MYTAREVTAVLGVPASRLRSYVREGLLAPRTGQDGEARFSFGDLVLLRKAEGLIIAGRLAPRRVQRALRLLRERDADLALSKLDLEAFGRQVVVSDGRHSWHPESGQLLLDLRPRGERPGTVTPLRTPEDAATPAAARAGQEAPAATLTAQELYERGCALDELAPDEARLCYEGALLKDPDHADAHVNLGRLLHEAGAPGEAMLHYRAALRARPRDAVAAFNLGVALEDLGAADEAMAAYQAALVADFRNADAHYNLARLHEQAGRAETAIRHLIIYRQLTRSRR